MSHKSQIRNDNQAKRRRDGRGIAGAKGNKRTAPHYCE
nr:MAG TPA: hypothetical protein [Caudoviricetes sp.]